MLRLKRVLGMWTERVVDRATNAGKPPPADVVVRMKEAGLLTPDNEIERVTPKMLEGDDVE